MTRRPVTIARGETVGTAATLMRMCRIRHLPVVDGQELAGMLSLRDVLGADDAARVADVMTAPCETVGPDDLLATGCQRMVDKQLSALAVVDNGQLAGVFTATDALRFATAALEHELKTQRRPADVAQLMTARPLVVVAPETSLVSAWELMQRARVRHLPVVDGDAIRGILSDRDLLQAGAGTLDGAALDGRLPAMRVADAMSTRLSTIAAERPAAEAARVLLRRRVGALPVLRGTRLVGILTVADFLYWIIARS